MESFDRQLALRPGKTLPQAAGLPVDAIAQSNGFIDDAYVKNLEAGNHKIVSHYDATFASDDPYPEIPVPRGPDPILDALVRAYGGAFVGYARDELGFKTDMSYNLLASDIAGKWDWEQGRRQASVDDDLRVLLALTPSFRLVIAHGYSDMVTPYAVSRLLIFDGVAQCAPKGTGRLPCGIGTGIADLRGGIRYFICDASGLVFGISHSVVEISGRSLRHVRVLRSNWVDWCQRANVSESSNLPLNFHPVAIRASAVAQCVLE